MNTLHETTETVMIREMVAPYTQVMSLAKFSICMHRGE